MVSVVTISKTQKLGFQRPPVAET